MVVSDAFGHELGTVLHCHKVQEQRFLVTLLKYLSTYPYGIWWRKKMSIVITIVISGLAFGCLFGVVVLMFSCGRCGCLTVFPSVWCACEFYPVGHQNTCLQLLCVLCDYL